MAADATGMQRHLDALALHGRELMSEVDTKSTVKAYTGAHGPERVRTMAHTLRAIEEGIGLYMEEHRTLRGIVLQHLQRQRYP